MPANVYAVSDPTADNLTRLGFVTDAGVVHRPAGAVEEVVGRVLPDGTVYTGDVDALTAVGYITEDGAIFRGDRKAAVQVGQVTRDGMIYRGAALVPLAVCGYVAASSSRAQMGGAALLLGLLD